MLVVGFRSCVDFGVNWWLRSGGGATLGLGSCIYRGVYE
jgi:hypothetical protein